MNYYIKKQNNKKNEENNDIIQKKTEKKRKNKRKCLDEEKFYFLIKKIKENENDDIICFNMLLLNSLLFFTGLRISEVMILNKENIQELFDKGKFNAYCKKTNTYRQLFLHNTMKNKFLDIFDIKEDKIDDFYKKINKNGIISKYGNKINMRTCYKWMDPYFKLLLFKYGGTIDGLFGNPWGFHSYRYNFITDFLIKSKFNVNLTAKAAGHKNPSTTLIYYNSLYNEEDEIINVLNKVF